MNEVSTQTLTQKQEAFCQHYVRTGGKVGISAKHAGYADRVAGSQQLRNPKVLKRIQELMTDNFSIHAVTAQDVLVKLVKSARSDYVRLEAAKDLLDRAGYRPPERVDHRVSGDLSVSFDITPSNTIIDLSPSPDTQEGGG